MYDPNAGVTATTTAATQIFDTANGDKSAITASALILMPPPGCTMANVSSDAAIVVNTNGGAAVDDGTSVLIAANTPCNIPVSPGVAVNALSLAGTANVRAMPYKNR